MVFPVYFLQADGTVLTFQAPTDFVYTAENGERYRYPLTAFEFWTDAEWAACCPTWQRLTYLDIPPAFDTSTHTLVRMDQGDWEVDAEKLTITVGYVVRQKTQEELAAEEASLKPPVPNAVTNFQARAALLRAGLFTQVNDAMLALPLESAARQAWEYANEVTRHGTLVNGVADQLGITSEQMDDLFRVAATIEA